jgi:hypothetical protein
MTLPLNPDPQPARKSPLKNPFLYTWLVLVVVAAYVVFLLLQRYESNRALERNAAERAAEQRRADDRAAIEQLGGSELAIRAFYATPAAIHRGQSSQLCYDVANVKTVSLDPPAGEVWPSHNRCLNVSPSKSTTYTLTITGASGKSISQSVELSVR